MKNKIKILVPVYNEEKNINLFYNHLLKYIKKLTNYNFKTIFIVDKSLDETEKKVINLCRKYKEVGAIILSRRYGHQASLLAGINKSLDADAVIMMDGDLQHPPNVIGQFLKKYEKGYDIVNTVRLEVKKNFIRNIFNKIFYSLFRIFSGYKLNNNSADFRLVSKKISKLISYNFKEKNIFLRGVISSLGFKQCSIEFYPKKRNFGETKYTFIKNLKFAFSALFSYSSKPLYISFVILFFFILLNFLSFLLILFFGSSKLFIFLIFVSTFLVFFVFTIYLGLIGIYIGSLMEEIKDRPNYIIEKIVN